MGCKLLIERRMYFNQKIKAVIRNKQGLSGYCMIYRYRAFTPAARI